MKASTTDYSRRIDWSAAKTKGDRAAQMRRQVVRFVGGIRGPREAGVTSKQILAWFHGTPADFVNTAILAAVAEDEINICRTALVRRSNERHVYEITDKGRALVATTAQERKPTAYERAWQSVIVALDDALAVVGEDNRGRFLGDLIDEADERRRAPSD